MSRFLRTFLLVSLCLTIIAPTLPDSNFVVQETQAARKKKKKKKPVQKFPDLKSPEDKKQFLRMIRESMTLTKVGRKVKFTSEQLDQRLKSQIGGSSSQYARVIGDDVFIRRVYLDLTGKLPPVEKIKSFVAKKESRKVKRAALIEELLASPDYGRRWAKYWTDVIFHESTSPRSMTDPKALEDWLTIQFNNNVPWDEIVAELVSAVPKSDKKDKLATDHWSRDIGPNNFVLANRRDPILVASQTARLFMGISIECAECHDHPFDKWKREQFHELTAFFSRGNHYMKSAEDPKKKIKMKPKFLLGEVPPEGLKSHDQRLVAAAGYLVYNPKNYWFARSFANRMWNELIGDGFYGIDSLGPDQDVLYGNVINRVSAVFRYEKFDQKWVFRLIMNSEMYQREIRTMTSRNELFTAVRPSALRPEQISGILIRLTGDDKKKNLEKTLEKTFRMSPSISQDAIEKTVQQSLFMMNNGTLHSRLASNFRNRIIKIKSNDELVKQIYLETLAREPTRSEKSRAASHLRRTKSRTEAVDDLIWVIVNSTEFMTKR